MVYAVVSNSENVSKSETEVSLAKKISENHAAGAAAR